jgi:hypothetical protein
MRRNVSLRVGKGPPVPHPNESEKLVEQIVGVNRKTSTFQVIQPQLPLNNERGKIETHESTTSTSAIP